MAAVVRTETPAAMATVAKRRLVAMASQSVKPDAATAGAVVVADGMTELPE